MISLTQQKKLNLKKKLDDLINTLNYTTNETQELFDLYQIAQDENNQIVINETLRELTNIEKIALKNQIKCFLSNETDSLEAYLEIHAGAGGTRVKIGHKC